MTVSVIIVSWNTRDLTLQAVESVWAQDFAEPVEVIVVDNASSDDSVEALRERHPNVRVLPLSRNLGFAGGNNVGLAHAQGEFTLLLNSDARLRPGTLRTLVDTARANPRAGALQPKLLSPDGTVQLTWDYVPSLLSELWLVLVTHRQVRSSAWQAQAQAWRQTRRVRGIGLATLLVPRWAWRRVGPLATEPFLYFEEADFSVRLRRAGIPMLFVPSAEVDHLLGSSTGQVPHRRRAAHYRSRMWFYDTHRDRCSAGLIRFLSAARACLGLARARRRLARGDVHAPAEIDQLWRPILAAARGR